MTEYKKCPYCGRELRCIGGGFSGPAYEACGCGGRPTSSSKKSKILSEEDREGCICHDFISSMKCPKHGAANQAMMSCI